MPYVHTRFLCVRSRDDSRAAFYDRHAHDREGGQRNGMAVVLKDKIVLKIGDKN